MIDGVVTQDREAIVTVAVHGKGGVKVDVDFVLDTGFTGYISLTIDEIDALDLRPGAPATFRFADGDDRKLVTYHASVIWDGALKSVLAIPLDDAHLLGMHLLSGCTVTVEVGVLGAVYIDVDTVEPFPTA